MKLWAFRNPLRDNEYTPLDSVRDPFWYSRADGDVPNLWVTSWVYDSSVLYCSAAVPDKLFQRHIHFQTFIPHTTSFLRHPLSLSTGAAGDETACSGALWQYFFRFCGDSNKLCSLDYSSKPWKHHVWEVTGYHSLWFDYSLTMTPSHCVNYCLMCHP